MSGKRGKREAGRRDRLALGALALALALALSAAAALRGGGDASVRQAASALRSRAETLRQAALSADWLGRELGEAPAGEAGFAVLFSVSDGERRARVWSASGGTLEEAWDKALETAERAARRGGPEPRWVKADVVFYTREVSPEALAEALRGEEKNFFRYGLSFSPDFSDAMLEAELNGAGIYDREAGTVDLEKLNAYRKGAGRPALEALPGSYTVFQTFGWLCGEEGEALELTAERRGYGRRAAGAEPEELERVLGSAADYLTGQIREDGSFAWGVYPGRGEEILGGGVLCQAEAVRALSRCPAEGEAAAAALERAARRLAEQAVYRDGETAYAAEEGGALRPEGCGLAVIALTEYMERTGGGEYRELCRALGKGILSMMDPETGAFCYAPGGDLTRKEESPAVCRDGEAAFALCRLYGLTGEAVWLRAARLAADRFIREDRARRAEPWVCLAMDELTKYVTDEPAYFAFALESAQRNLEEIRDRVTAAPADLELLMAAFEVYERARALGAAVTGFDPEALVTCARERAERQLDAFFYPEYAMYMERPERVLGAFMARQEDFRVRVDDVGRGMMGLCLYKDNLGVFHF